MNDPRTTDRNAQALGKLAHLRIELALVMQELRTTSGLTQRDLAERLQVNQPAIAKLERVGDHKIETVLRYLAEFDADLLMGVMQGGDFVQVSDDEEYLLMALPREVDAWAAEQGKDLDEYVLDAVRKAHEADHHELTSTAS